MRVLKKVCNYYHIHETKMKIAYICDRNTFLHKMSRVRFHSIEAISKIHQVEWFGKFWDGWSHNLSVDENFDRIGYEPDLIIGYKLSFKHGD